jgi:anti-sigma factor RsiW
MITCRELVDFLNDYLDGALPPRRRAEFERHLEACPECVSYLESYRETIRLGKRAFATDAKALPADVPEELVKAILAARRKRG